MNLMYFFCNVLGYPQMSKEFLHHHLGSSRIPGPSKNGLGQAKHQYVRIQVPAGLFCLVGFWFCLIWLQLHRHLLKEAFPTFLGWVIDSYHIFQEASWVPAHYHGAHHSPSLQAQWGWGLEFSHSSLHPQDLAEGQAVNVCLVNWTPSSPSPVGSCYGGSLDCFLPAPLMAFSIFSFQP